MTVTIGSLGEIGVAGTDPAMLTPIDLPLLRNGVVWDLSIGPYDAIEFDVWELRQRTKIVSPGTIVIFNAALGIVRWTPTAASFASGIYEARIRLSTTAGVTWEPAGLFRFSVGAGI